MTDRISGSGAQPSTARLSRRTAVRVGMAGSLTAAVAPASIVLSPAMPAASPAAVKVLTVAMYQDFGRLDDPLGGEASHWVLHDQLTARIEIPGSYAPLFCDDTQEQWLVVTGEGPANAASTMMAVGLSEHLDLRQSYILIAGIAGVAPSGGTLGTAAWAEWIVDGATANLIDPRELPADWLYPYFHLGCTTPWCSDGFTTGTEVFRLDPAMTTAAYELSKEVALADSAEAQKYRAAYSDAPAMASPRVVRGDCIASPSFTSGSILSNFAAWWMRQWTAGQGTYVMTSMEDSGTLAALRRLADAGRIDWRRIMLLRAGSNFDRPAPGESALAAIAASDKGGSPIAYDIALDNAYRAGSTVAQHILSDWTRWQSGP